MSADRFIIVNSEKRSFVYKTGDKVQIELKATHGQSPYAWSYLNLPAGLVGTKDGKVHGLFNEVGYYSFSASANDADGNTADCYYTFNIQPANAVGT